MPAAASKALTINRVSAVSPRESARQEMPEALRKEVRLLGDLFSAAHAGLPLYASLPLHALSAIGYFCGCDLRYVAAVCIARATRRSYCDRLRVL